MGDSQVPGNQRESLHNYILIIKFFVDDAKKLYIITGKKGSQMKCIHKIVKQIGRYLMCCDCGLIIGDEITIGMEEVC